MSIYRSEQLHAETMELYEQGLPPGYSTGWPSVDANYTVAPSEWTLVTGVPGSGKSEWLDALMVNLAKRHRWQFFVYSPENWPVALHAAKLSEKYVGKPFGKGPTTRMEKDELDEALAWINNTWNFCSPEDGSLAGILSESAKTVSKGKTWMTGIVIDPWNYVEHERNGMTEADYLSFALGQLVDFVRGGYAKRNHGGNVHVWVVAHPKIMQKAKDGSYPIPRPHDISGGAHWWNKADTCITVHRDQAEGNQEVQIHVQKGRFKHISRVGVSALNYDKVTGRYSELLSVVNAAADRYRYRSGGE